MKRTIPISYSLKMAALVALVILPIIMPAQTLKESASRLEQSVKALKKIADYPDQMAAWDLAKTRYNDSIAKLNSMEKVAGEKEKTWEGLKKRYDDIEKLASGLRPNAVQQAEVVLTRRYNADDVQQALVGLNPNADISMRLAQYEAMNKILISALSESDTIKEERTNYNSPEYREKYLNRVFGEIMDKLGEHAVDLFTPEAYPYLYNVLNEALEAKMKDTSLNLKEFIVDKL